MSAVAALTLTACSAVPVVDYHPASDKIYEGRQLNDTHSRYAFWTTALHFSKDASGEMTVTAAAAEDPYRTNVLELSGEDHWYKTTALSLVTAADSDLLASVNVTVTDHLATTIGDAAEVAVALAGVRSPYGGGHGPNPCSMADAVPAVAGDAQFDEELNVYQFLRQLDDGACPDISRKQVPRRRIDFAADGVPAVAVLSVEPPPPSALELNAETAPEILAAVHNVFLFPACRNATVEYESTVVKAGAPIRRLKHTVHFRFADPRYAEAIPLPVKGSLTVKPQCGMSLQDSGDASTTEQVAKAMADAVQSVAGAVQKKQ